ncbi:MAG: LysE family translocator [Sulfurospirillum sp.]|nr:LysE family translocator [Sulfurospirillum sp.]
MFGVHNLEIFIFSCITLNLIPANDTIFIISKAISEDKKAGVIAALGINTGAVFHIIFAALGLSALLFSFSYTFDTIKFLGATYLVYLGITTLLKNKKGLHVSQIHIQTSLFRTYKQAILTNVLNPKVALFFLAFLPQFVDSNTPHKAFSFLFLGIIFLVTSTTWCIFLALFASFSAKKIQTNAKTLTNIAAFVYITLGLKLFFEKH